MDKRANEIIAIGDGLFTDRVALNSLWQSTAEQFYPERADFTYVRSAGQEFASHLMTGVPAMASRDLANAIAAMLRPPGQVWFHPRTNVEAINKDSTARRWLDYAGNIMRSVMYSHFSGWARASKEGDRDFVTIGNTCIHLRPNEDMNGLVYRTYHMRDVAWAENESGRVDTFHAKRKITNRNLIRQFKKPGVDPKVVIAEEKNPHELVNCRLVVMPSAEYDSAAARDEATPGGGRRRTGHNLPFVAIWIDVDHQHIMQEIGQWQAGFIPPRWETVPGFGYGYSPATVINIADARMLQQITLTLLEAGQKAVDPPMQAMGQVIQGGVNLYAGGITWVDSEYDERGGAALKALMNTNPNLGWGVDREKRIAEIIANGHYLNQIKLPDTSHARTAFEVQKLWEEFIRNTTPLFEPISSEYNGEICDQTFEMLLRMNGFGSRKDIPQILRSQNIRFDFDSPLTVAASRAAAQAFTQVGQITQLGVALDPTIVHDLDVDTAYRDALEGSGAPATWIVDKQKADALKKVARAQAAAQQAQQQAMDTTGQAADLGSKIGNAATLLSQGGLLPQQPAQNGGSM